MVRQAQLFLLSYYIGNMFRPTHRSSSGSGVPRGGFGVFKTPRNAEDIGGVPDCTSKKNRRLDFLLQFTVFSYGCNLLNKGFF